MRGLRRLLRALNTSTSKLPAACEIAGVRLARAMRRDRGEFSDLLMQIHRFAFG
jgi:hypothetical protein